MSARQCSRPLIPLCLCLLAGIIVGDRFPGYLLASQLAAGGLLVMLLAGIWRWARLSSKAKQALFTVNLGLLFGVLGYFLIQPWRVSFAGPTDIRHWVDGPRVRIRGTVTGTVVNDVYGLRFDLARLYAWTQYGWQSRWGGVRVRARKAPALQPGQRLEISGRLKPVRGMQNPGGFDYHRYLADRNLLARMRVPSRAAITILPPDPRNKFAETLRIYREGVQASLAQHLQPPALGVLQALVTGDRQQIDVAVLAHFRHSGAAHLLAISGLHVGIVGALAFGLLRWLMRWVPFIVTRGWGTRAAALGALGPIWLYGGLSGMAPSTLRAVVMATVVLAAILIGRRPDSFNTLAVAALVIVGLHPPVLFAVSFQLSFMAVFWLLLGFAKTPGKTVAPAPHPMPTWRKVLGWTGTLVKVSVLAWAATLPLVMYYFNTLAWASVPVNVLAVPLISLWVVPLGLVGAVLCGCCPGLAALFFKASAWGLTPTLAWVEWAAQVPRAWTYTFTPSILEIVLFYLMLYGVIKWWRGRGEGFAIHLTSRVQRLAVLLVAGCLCLDAGYWCYQRWWRNDLRVTLLDVGQGTATVVAFPKGPVWLVDGGGFSNNQVFDIGHRIVAPYLWRNKICRVERVVLSHPNSDHLNGLLFILSHFGVQRFWSNGQTVDTAGYRQLQQILSAKEIRHPAFSQIPRRTVVNGTRVDVLHPAPQDMLDRSNQALNRNSMVLRIAHRGHSILLSGDLTCSGEQALMDRHPAALPSDVIVVPHHGSRTSSCAPFIKAVQPTHGLISCGWRNRFGFPHPAVIARYRARGTRLWRTDQYGALRAIETSRGWRILPTIRTVLPPSSGPLSTASLNLR